MFALRLLDIRCMPVQLMSDGKARICAVKKLRTFTRPKMMHFGLFQDLGHRLFQLLLLGSQ